MAEVRRSGEDSAMSDRSIADLVKQLSDQTMTLVHQELDLAKAELTAKGRKATLGAGMFGAAGVVGLYAFGVLTACVLLALSTTMDGWLAALIVGIVYGAVAGVLALVGNHKVKEGVPPVPEQAVESIKDDVQWTKQRAKDGRR